MHLFALARRPSVQVAVAIALLAGAGASGAEETTILHSFTGAHGAGQPSGSPVYARNNQMYGTTSPTDGVGGGSLYRWDFSRWEYTTLHWFDADVEGVLPVAPLLEGRDKAVYGSTTSGSAGGQSPHGAIYRFTPDGALAVLHSFSGVDGASPASALVQDRAGVLYGTARQGGAAGRGVVFSLNRDGTRYRVLHSFVGGPASGSDPVGGLAIGKDGRLYGVTAAQDDASLAGVVYSLGTDGIDFRVLHHFATDGTEGLHALGTPARHPNGYFYGTAELGGGACGCGTVWRIDPAGQFEVVHRFSGRLDGAHPRSDVTFGDKGQLYGSAANGGPDDQGVAWKLDMDGLLEGTVLFTAETEDPEGRLTPLGSAFSGRAVGTSLRGGDFGFGTLYRLPPAFPPPADAPPSVRVRAMPAVASVGAAATLLWHTRSADSCVASGAWDELPRGALSGTKSYTPDAPGTFTYTLTCTNENGATTVSDTQVVERQ